MVFARRHKYFNFLDKEQASLRLVNMEYFHNHSSLKNEKEMKNSTVDENDRLYS